MSSKFWASSEDVSSESVEASEQSHDSRDLSTSQLAGLSLGQSGETSSRSSAVVPRTATANAGTSELQPFQHANLFYLALIQGRCRTQAATVINAGRDADEKVGEDDPQVLDLSRHMFDEIRQELLKVGMLSEEYATGDQPQLHTYLNTFDNIIGNFATQKTRGITGGLGLESSNISLPHTLNTNTSNSNLTSAVTTRQLAGQRPHPTSRLTDLDIFGANGSVRNTSLFNTSGALIPRNLFVAPDNYSMGLTSSFQTLLRHVFPEEDHSKHVHTGASHYAANFTQLSKLGSGGFGSVYKVRNKFDKGEYAIKKIIVKREHLQKLYNNNKIADLAYLIKEVQTLAKLEHHNVVLYQHYWMEARALDDDSSSDDSSDEGTETTTKDRRTETLSLDPSFFANELSLARDMRVQRRRASSSIAAEMAAGIDVGHIIFSDDDSTSQDRDKDSNDQSQQTDDGEADEDDSEGSDEDTEEIMRYDGQLVRSPRKDLRHAEFDLVLFIKMAPYPLSLQEYIRQYTDKPKTDSTTELQHCYHVRPTVQLLLSILDGIEYIHRKNIVHRDLKPANILLQILDPSDKPTSGYINTKECGHCPKNKPVWISPRIGDFGLIHDLSSPPPVPAADQEGGLGTAPGTATYLPLNLRKSSPIDAKLDVYSLGIIAFEMSYKFGTSTERVHVLDKLKRSAVVPLDFEEHPLKECVLNMVKEDVKTRWDCSSVRACLEQILESL